VNSLIKRGSQQKSNSNDIISTPTEKSNKNFSENDSKNVATDSAGNKLSKQQQEYFKDSKVRDENGNLLVVYHGTDADFTVFDKTKGRANMDIQGLFFSPWELDAGGYGSKVLAGYLNITNPAPESVGYKALNKFKGQNNAGVKAREYLISLGYDGVNNGNEEYIAFESNQFKNADNLNPTSNPDIMYSKGMTESLRKSVSEEVDKYTEEQYNNYGWVTANNVMSPAERETILSRYADYKHNGDKYPVTRFGEVVINSSEHPNIIAYVKGDIGNPTITKVIKINAENELLSEINKEILHNERRQIPLPYENVVDLFGEEILTNNKRKDYASFQEYIAGTKRVGSKESNTDYREGENGIGSVQSNKANDRADGLTPAFSMPKTEDIRYSLSPEHLRYNPEKYVHWLLRHNGLPSGQGYVEEFTSKNEKPITRVMGFFFALLFLIILQKVLFFAKKEKTILDNIWRNIV